MKNVLTPILLLPSTSMAASVISPPTNIQFLDSVSYMATFTGSPVGTFDVETSLDYNPLGQNPALPRNDTGSWAPLGLNIATSGGSPQVIDLNQLSMPWVRLHYTRSSGTGTLQVFISSKAV